MAGYKIEQLLEWAQDDHLITAYKRMPDGRFKIFVGHRASVLDEDDAVDYVMDLFRKSVRQPVAHTS